MTHIDDLSHPKIPEYNFLPSAETNFNETCEVRLTYTFTPRSPFIPHRFPSPFQGKPQKELESSKETLQGVSNRWIILKTLEDPNWDSSSPQVLCWHPLGSWATFLLPAYAEHKFRIQTLLVPSYAELLPPYAEPKVRITCWDNARGLYLSFKH